MHGQPPASSRGRLRTLGLRPRKGLSQSFLDDRSIAAAIVRAARLDPARDAVLEVGPGLGVLTELLVRAARQVVAVELDPDLASWLRSEFGASVTVHTADILKFDPSGVFESDFVVVANLPYHVASPALRHLLEGGPPFASRLVVMLQAEVAERITARPGNLSGLAVGIQVQATAKLVRKVSRNAFYPSPKVDSAVLMLEPLPDPERLVPRADQQAFAKLVQAGFKQPRKTLGNSLAEGLGIPKPLAVQLLDRAQVDASRRPQELKLEAWARLFRAHAS